MPITGVHVSTTGDPLQADAYPPDNGRRLFSLASTVGTSPGYPRKIALWGTGAHSYVAVLETSDGQNYSPVTVTDLETLTGHTPLPGIGSGQNLWLSGHAATAGLRTAQDATGTYYSYRSAIVQAPGTPTTGTDLICLFYMSSNQLYEIVLQCKADGTLAATCTTSGVGFGFGSNFQYLDCQFDPIGTVSTGGVPYGAGMWHISMAYGTSSGKVAIIGVKDTITQSAGVVTGVSLTVPYKLDNLLSSGNWRGLKMRLAGSAATPTVGATIQIIAYDGNANNLKLITVTALVTGSPVYVRLSGYPEVVGKNTIGAMGNGGYNGSFDFALLTALAGASYDLVFYAAPGDPVLTGVIGYIQQTNFHSYSAITRINNAVGKRVTTNYNAQPVLAWDQATGDLTTYFVSYEYQSTGELWYSTLSGGSWSAANGLSSSGIATGSYGYDSPTCTETWNSNPAPGTGWSQVSDLIYTTGTSSPYPLYWDGPSGGAQPLAPSDISPTGVVITSGGTPTPAVSWTYNNPSGTDPENAYRVQVKQGSTMMWDSNKQQPSSATSVVYGSIGGSPTTLAYNTQYTAIVDTWDKILNIDSGLTNASSNFALFHAPTVSLTASGASVKQGPASTGATISPGGNATGPLLSITGKITQAEGRPATIARINLIGPDGISILKTTGDFSLTAQGSPNTASGTLVGPAPGNNNYQGVPDFDFYSATNVAIDNSQTYYLQMVVTFSAGFGNFTFTGASPLFSFVPYFTPPNPVTGLSATPNMDLGTVTLAWTPAASQPGTVTVAGFQAYAKPALGSVWVPIGDLLPDTATTATVRGPGNAAYDYDLRCVSDLGVNSAAPSLTLSTGITLLMSGMWLTDVLDITKNVNLVSFDGGDWGTSTAVKRNMDVNSYVPAGATAPITTYKPTDYRSRDGMRWFIPGIYSTASGNVLGTDVLAMLDAMESAHHPLLGRDASGESWVGDLRDYTPNSEPGQNYTVVMSLIQNRRYAAINPYWLVTTP